MLGINSEYNDALYVEGIGWIAQHHCYIDMCWEKGLPYFVRDIMPGVFPDLNSNIREHERLQHAATKTAESRRAGPTSQRS